MEKSSKRKKIEENEELRELSQDLDKAKALDLMASSDGGVLLKEALVIDIVGTIDTFSYRYKEATLQEFVGWGADLNKMLGILRTMTRAKETRKILKDELEKALGE